MVDSHVAPSRADPTNGDQDARKPQAAVNARLQS